MFKKALTLGCMIAVAFPLHVSATQIIDPDGVGANQVSLGLSTTSDITVGFSGADGALEINASSAGNGITSLDRDGMIIGLGSSGAGNGLVRVVGDGTSGSAGLNLTDFIRNGLGSEGTLEIRDGAVVEADGIRLSDQAFSGDISNSTTIVDGAGSVLRRRYRPTSSTGQFFVGESAGATTDLTISNGGLVESLGGDLNNFEAGHIFIGSSADDSLGRENTEVTVNVTGANSILRAQHGIFINESTGSVAVNVTNGGTMEQQEAGYVFDGVPNPGISVSSFVGANLNVDGTGSAVHAATDIQIGSSRTLVGLTAAGKPRTVIANGLVEGEQSTDVNGELLFYPDGSPIFNIEEEIAPGFSLVVPETFLDANKIRTKATGHLLVQNDAVVTTLTDLTISNNDADPSVVPFSGEASSVTVRAGGVINAQNVIVNQHGILQGDGGTINANVMVDGGTVAPGDSPGVMDIVGDLVVNSGILELEFDGVAMDLLRVGGDVIIGADASIHLLLGFLPGPAELINIDDFFEVSGAFDVAAFDPSVGIKLLFDPVLGIQSGEFLVGLAGEQYQISFSEQGSVPVAPTFLLMVIGMLGVLASRRTNAGV